MDPVRVATLNAREVSAIQSDIGKWSKDVTSLLYATQAVKGAMLMHINVVCDKDHRPDTETLKSMAKGNQYVTFVGEKDGGIIAKTDKDHYGPGVLDTCAEVIQSVMDDYDSIEALKIRLDQLLVSYKEAKAKVKEYEAELDIAKNGNRNALAAILTEVWCEDNGKSAEGKYDSDVACHRMGSVSSWDRGAAMITKGRSVVLDEPKF